MAFWSSQKIEANLARLTDYPEPRMVDCNALTLRVGSEIYITPGLEQTAPNSHTKKKLKAGEPIAIPPGQFAFLLTAEMLTIPDHVMGFISIRATYKLRGLVNVSGFHVDPGWTGRLIFTVFNAGPAPIHLEQGLPMFLLWISDLDEESEKRKTEPGPEGIPPAVITNMTGVVDSIYALEKRMKSEIVDVADKQEAFRDLVNELKERQHKILLYFGIAAIVGGALVGALAKMILDHVFVAPSPVVAVTAAPPRADPSTVIPTPAMPPATIQNENGNSAIPKKTN